MIGLEDQDTPVKREKRGTEVAVLGVVLASSFLSLLRQSRPVKLTKMVSISPARVLVVASVIVGLAREMMDEGGL